MEDEQFFDFDFFGDDGSFVEEKCLDCKKNQKKADNKYVKGNLNTYLSY